MDVNFTKKSGWKGSQLQCSVILSLLVDFIARSDFCCVNWPESF